MHKYFAQYGAMDRWPVAQREYPRLISLPIYPGLSTEDIEHVAAQVRAVVSPLPQASLRGTRAQPSMKTLIRIASQRRCVACDGAGTRGGGRGDRF